MPKDNPVDKGFVVLRENDEEIRIFFRITKKHDVSDSTLLFVHGLGTTHNIWKHQEALLSPEYTVISLDLRGFGKSTKPKKSTYSYDCFVNDIHILLDQLKVETVIYVGVDLGASIGLSFAYKHPNYIQKLVFAGANPLYVSPTSVWPFSQFTPEAITELHNAIELDAEAAIFNLVDTYLFPDQCTSMEHIKEFAVQTLLNIPPLTLARILGKDNPESWVYQDLREVLEFLPSLEVPILLLIGTRSGRAVFGSFGALISNFAPISPYIFQFIGKGNYSNMTDVTTYTEVLNDFLHMERLNPECDLCDIKVKF